MKRFQHSNWLIKLSRYRHYMYIPFKWVWYQYFSAFYVTNYETFEDERVTSKMLWKLLIGVAQTDMKWYWTHQEVMANFGMLDEDFMDPDDYDYIDIEDDIDETEYWKGID